MANNRAIAMLAGAAGLLALVVLGSCSNHRGQPFVPVKPGDGIDSTKVEGLLETQTWLASESPYYVMKAATLRSGRTLTIQPGVTVIFVKKGLNLTINGKLVAVGAAPIASHITFRATTAVGAPQSPGDWGSLIFSGSSGSHLRYVDVSYAHTGITATDSDLLVEQSNIARCLVDGLDLTRTRLTLTDCQLANNGQYGLWLSECHEPLYPVRITHCNIGNNVWGGIWSINSAPQIRRSDIKNNGVSYDAMSRALASGNHFEGLPGLTLPLFSHCNIEANRPCDVRNVMRGGSVVVADSNYWGLTTTSQMDALSNLANPDSVFKWNCAFNVRAICDAQDSLDSPTPTVTFCYWSDTVIPNFSTSGSSPGWNPPPPLVR